MKGAAAPERASDRAARIVRILFILLAVLCGAAIVYIAVEYHRFWTYGPFHRDVHLYGAIFLLVLFGAGALLSAENRIRLLMVVISTAFTLYLFQGVFYFMFSGNVAARIAQSAGAEFDTRSKTEFIEDLRRQGEDIHHAATPAHWLRSDGISWSGEQLYPLAGLSRRSQVMCNESGRWIRFQTDRHGFNNPDSAWEGRPHVVLIGDSWVHGVCVDAGEDVAGVFRKSGWKTINLSVTGNGPLIQLATLIEYARKARPRLVLWAYYEENDLRNLKGERDSRTLVRYLRDDQFSQNLASRQATADGAIRHFVSSSRRSASALPSEVQFMLSFLQFGVFRNWLASDDNTLAANRLIVAGDYRYELEMFQEILIRAKRETEAWGGKIAFVYLPRWARYAQHEKDGANLRHEVKAMADKAGMPVFDFHDVLAVHPDPPSLFPFRINGHFTPEGNALLAHELSRWVAGNRLLDK
jgi:hypothetical protein